ncbi:MAG: hypothetical protein Q8P00_06180, partial [Dehalococcoidia bacterium]|nr:hypothetical protein [Dehalococcoidia bacterium]
MPQDNGTFTPEEVEAVKAQLTAELQTRDQAVEQLQTALGLAREEANAVKAGRQQDALAGQTALDE